MFDFNKTLQLTTHLMPQSIYCVKSLMVGLISQNAKVNWPPRNCDLTSLDYFLWGAYKPETIEPLKTNSRIAVADIRSHTLEKKHNPIDSIEQSTVRPDMVFHF
ncbi:hypothetical protein DOY81_006315 [Sarcophaga bullata]|nr:hypothetical protein DOY81_006315 [Sarcophaga bullata]